MLLTIKFKLFNTSGKHWLLVVFISLMSLEIHAADWEAGLGNIVWEELNFHMYQDSPLYIINVVL